MAAEGGSLGARMMGAALLSVDTFEAVEHDRNATMQAATVVMIVAACEAIGAAERGLGGAVTAAAAALIAWVAWAGITYLIGDKVFGGTATWGELLRTLGFAQAPGVLYLLAIVPLLGWPVPFFVSLWIVVAGFIAIRQALDIGNAKTFLTMLVGGVVYGVLHAIF